MHLTSTNRLLQGMWDRPNSLGKALRILKETIRASNSPSDQYLRIHAQSLIRSTPPDITPPYRNMDLPTLDFSQFLHGSTQQRVNLGQKLVASFEKHGFVKLINHGVPESTVKDYLQGVKVLWKETNFVLISMV